MPDHVTRERSPVRPRLNLAFFWSFFLSSCSFLPCQEPCHGPRTRGPKEAAETTTESHVFTSTYRASHMSKPGEQAPPWVCRTCSSTTSTWMPLPCNMCRPKGGVDRTQGNYMYLVQCSFHTVPDDRGPSSGCWPRGLPRIAPSLEAIRQPRHLTGTVFKFLPQESQKNHHIGCPSLSLDVSQ